MKVLEHHLVSQTAYEETLPIDRVARTFHFVRCFSLKFLDNIKMDRG